MKTLRRLFRSVRSRAAGGEVQPYEAPEGARGFILLDEGSYEVSDEARRVYGDDLLRRLNENGSRKP